MSLQRAAISICIAVVAVLMFSERADASSFLLGDAVDVETEEIITTGDEAVEETVSAPAFGTETNPIEPLEEVMSTTAEPVTSTVEDAAEPVTRTVAQVSEPVTELAERVTEVVEPVTETVEPVVESVATTVEPVVEAVEPVSEPVVEPVVEIVEPVIAPVVEAVEPAVDPVVETIAPVTEPVLDTVEPVVAAPVTEAVEPLVEPAIEIVTDITLAPVMEAIPPQVLESSDLAPAALAPEVVAPDAPFADTGPFIEVPGVTVILAPEPALTPAPAPDPTTPRFGVQLPIAVPSSELEPVGDVSLPSAPAPEPVAISVPETVVGASDRVAQPANTIDMPSSIPDLSGTVEIAPASGNLTDGGVSFPMPDFTPADLLSPLTALGATAPAPAVGGDAFGSPVALAAALILLVLMTWRAREQLTLAIPSSRYASIPVPPG